MHVLKRVNHPRFYINGEGGLESCSLAVYTCAGAYPEEGDYKKVQNKTKTDNKNIRTKIMYCTQFPKSN